jgi:hypothetical protein
VFWIRDIMRKGRIRSWIRIRTCDQRIRIQRREAHKHMDPDPEHCFVRSCVLLLIRIWSGFFPTKICNLHCAANQCIRSVISWPFVSVYVILKYKFLFDINLQFNCYYQCCGSMTIWCGSGSMPLMDPAPM